MPLMRLHLFLLLHRAQEWQRFSTQHRIWQWEENCTDPTAFRGDVCLSIHECPSPEVFLMENGFGNVYILAMFQISIFWICDNDFTVMSLEVMHTMVCILNREMKWYLGIDLIIWWDRWGKCRKILITVESEW